MARLRSHGVRYRPPSPVPWYVVVGAVLAAILIGAAVVWVLAGRSTLTV